MSDTNKISREAWWESVKRSKDSKYVEITEPDAIPAFTAEEWDALRFRISNHSMRLAECINPPHRDPVVFRLFPPHLWNIVDGKIMQKVGGKWVRFVPKLEENLDRFSKS